MIYMFQIIKEDNEEEWVLKLALQGGWDLVRWKLKYRCQFERKMWGKTKAVGGWGNKIFDLIPWKKHHTFEREKGKLPKGWKRDYVMITLIKRKEAYWRDMCFLYSTNLVALKAELHLDWRGERHFTWKALLQVTVLGSKGINLEGLSIKWKGEEEIGFSRTFKHWCQGRNLVSVCTYAVVSLRHSLKKWFTWDESHIFGVLWD